MQYVVAAVAAGIPMLVAGAVLAMVIRREPAAAPDPILVRLDEEQYRGWLTAMDPYGGVAENGAPSDADELEYQLMLAAGDFFLQQGSGETMAQFAATLGEIADLPETVVDEGWQA